MPLQALLARPRHAFDQELLHADPQFRRLSPADAARAIAAAVADGRRHAASWDGSPGAMASAIGLPVRTVRTSNRFGPIFQFAEYRSRPPGIAIYQEAMDLPRREIRWHGLADALGLDDPEPVYLAHEIYHHLDAAAAVSIARSVPVTTLALGALRLRSGLVSLTEIAAAAFAQSLTGLSCHPRLLDVLARNALVR